MKRRISLIIAVMLMVLVLQPVGGEAASVSQIKKDIAAAKQQMKNAAAKAAKAQTDAAKAVHDKEDIAGKKIDAQASIKKLMAELDNVVINKNKTQKQLDDKEEELLLTGQELDQAEERIVTRDQLLQSRMRLMYTNGFVSYMDVLLSAASFSDFIDRFDALQSILTQDREMLDEHKKDKELVLIKKAQVEQELKVVQGMYKKLELYETHLITKEQEKERLIAQYNANIKTIDNNLEELENISEEQEKLLMQLAAKVSKLNTQLIANPYSGGRLGMPIKDNYRVTSSFGTRTHPISGKKHTHTGMDFAAPSGTAIYAAEDGVVLVAQSWSSYGNTVIIDHGNGLWTLYGHIRNNGIKVDKGQKVKKGDKIAEVGSTGNSTGPHLHFEVRKNETPVNPGAYLK